MATFYPPPPPFVGGTQPLAGHLGNVPSEAVQVDNPPPAHPARTTAQQALIAASWQQPDPPQVLAEHAPIAQPDQFVAASAEWLSQVIAAWNVPGVAPVLPRLLPVPITAVRGDNPPFGVPSGSQVAILAAWIAPDPAPVQRARGQIASIDTPPFAQPARLVAMQATAAASWVPADPAAQQRLPGRIVSVDAPPVRGPPSWQTQTLASWISPDPAQVRPVQTPIVAPADTFLPGPARWLSSILSSWGPPDPQPIPPRQLPPVITAVQVDNPPFGVPSRSQTAILTTWVPPDPLPALRGRLVQPPVASSVAFGTDPWLVGVLAAWQTPDPAPTLPRRLPPTITAVPVNNPPFAGPPRSRVAILAAWTPPDPLPALNARRATLGTAATEHPFTREFSREFARGASTQKPPRLTSSPLASILSAWIPQDPPPTLPRRLPTAVTAVRGDNPPFAGPPRSQSVILSAWVPQDPTPTLPRHLPPSVTAVPVNNPPFGQAKFSPVHQAWIPPDPLPILPVKKTPPSVAVIAPPVIKRPAVKAWSRRRDQWFPWAGADSGAFTVQAPPPRVVPKKRRVSWATWRRLSWFPFPGTKPAGGLPNNAPPQPAPVSQLPTILAAWIPPPPAPILPQRLPPSVTAVAADTPPFGVPNPALQVVLTAWQPPPPQPILPRAVPASVAAVMVNNPPFVDAGRPSSAQSLIAAAWQPPPPAPILPRVLPAVVSAGPPQKFRRTKIRPWVRLRAAWFPPKRRRQVRPAPPLPPIPGVMKRRAQPRWALRRIWQNPTQRLLRFAPLLAPPPPPPPPPVFTPNAGDVLAVDTSFGTPSAIRWAQFVSRVPFDLDRAIQFGCTFLVEAGDSLTRYTDFTLIFTKPDGTQFVSESRMAYLGRGIAFTQVGAFLPGTYVVYGMPAGVLVAGDWSVVLTYRLVGSQQFGSTRVGHFTLRRRR